MALLEVCANSITSAIAAEKGGASRIELCENLAEGGTTPSYGQITITRQQLIVPINVLIRPRPGDFFYTDLEFEIMKADIEFAASAGCNGVVFGILDTEGNVDKVRCAELTELAHENGLSVTFHRAFDVCRDYYAALEDIIKIGCDRILTSGGRPTALEGAPIIAQLVKKANGRIVIMPGSGVNEGNARELIDVTNVTEIHSSAKTKVKSPMQYLNDHMGDQVSANTLDQTDPEIVKKIVEAIR